MRIYTRIPLSERFWAKVTKGDGCWEWTAGLKNNGYGAIGIGGKSKTMLYAHRVSWEMHNGPIPDGLYVCHRCDNPKCVRPDHLLLGTQKHNMADAMAKGRTSPPPLNTRRPPRCLRGHEFTGRNLILKANGDRQCRECGRLRYKAYVARRAAKRRAARSSP